MTAATATPSLLQRRRAPVLRPTTAGDREALASFLGGLSPHSSLQRFFTGGFRPTNAVLDSLLGLTQGRAFVAVEGERIVGHAMWAPFPQAPHRADIAFVVAEDRRRLGLATELTQLAISDAVANGAETINATVRASNRGAIRVVRKLLPCATSSIEGGEFTYDAPVAPCAALPTAV